MKIEDIKKYQLDGYFTLNEDGEELEDFAKIKLIEFCAQDIQTIIRYGIPELLARIKKEDDELLMAKYSEKYHITPEDFLVRFEFENKVGDIVKVYSNGEKKEARIVSIKKVYEDQLPLPMQKLSKVYR